LAAGISLQLIGDTANSKDEAKLNFLSTESSPALITCVRDFCSATFLQQKESTARGIFYIAAQLYGLHTEVFGAVPFSTAIASHLTAGGSLPN
jgi:hypothetical protein